MRVKLGFALGWLVAQFVIWQTSSVPTTRVGLGLVTLAAVPLIAVLTLNPARRRG